MSNDTISPWSGSCPDAAKLDAFVSGGIAGIEASRIEAHIADCPACRLQVEAAGGDTAAIFARVREAFPNQATKSDLGEVGNAADATLDAGAAPARSVPGRLPTIDGYETVRELHRGGQGIVFQAIQKSTKRKVAVKVLLEGAYASSAARRRFEREIELVAQLKHSNIIEIFHSGETPDGHAYCVMDYVRGSRLDQFVREKKLDLEAALRLFAQVCSAVNYAHQKGVIHRDLKPSNILVDADGTPKVLDFGLAKQAVSPAESLVSITGQVVGTLPYMSPEQARGNPDEIDTRTDIYALGVILYELLTGEYPYPVFGQMADVLKHIADTPPTPPSRSWKSTSGITTRSDRRLKAGQCPIDDELQTIVLKALSKERERRYQSAGDLGEDLQRYLDGEPIEAKKDSGWYVLKKNLRRHRLALRVAAAFVIVLTGAVIVSGLGWRRAAENERRALDGEQAAKGVLIDLVRDGLRNWDESDVTERAAAAGLDVKIRKDNDEVSFLIDPKPGEEIPRLAAFSRELFTWLEESKQNEAKRVRELERVLEFQARQLGEISVRQMGTNIRDRVRSQILAYQQLGESPFEKGMQPSNYIDEIFSELDFSKLALDSIESHILKPTIAAAEKTLATEPLLQARLFEMVARIYLDLGLLKEAHDIQQQALKIHEDHLGEFAPTTLASKSFLAYVLTLSDRLQEADSIITETLHSQTQIIGRSHINTLDSILRKGYLRWTQGRLVEAEALYSEAVNQREALLGADHPSVLEAKNFLSGLYYTQGNLAASESILRMVIPRQRKVLGDLHADTLSSLSNLGITLKATGQLDEAEKVIRESLKGRLTILGTEHPDTLITESNLAHLILLRGNPTEAVDRLNRIIDVADDVFGTSHWWTSNFKAKRALAYIELGRFEDAESSLLDAFGVLKDTLGEDHRQTLKIASHLVELYRAWDIERSHPRQEENINKWTSYLKAHTPYNRKVHKETDIVSDPDHHTHSQDR